MILFCQQCVRLVWQDDQIFASSSSLCFCPCRYRIPRSGKPPGQLLHCVHHLWSIAERAAQRSRETKRKGQKRSRAAAIDAAEEVHAVTDGGHQRPRHQTAVMLLRRTCDEHIEVLCRLEHGRKADADGEVTAFTTGPPGSNEAGLRQWRLQAAAAVRTEELQCWKAFKAQLPDERFD